MSNPNKLRRYRRNFRKRNLKYQANYYRAHPEKQRTRSRKWYAAHREERREYSRNYRLKFPKKVRQTKRRYNRSHPEKGREQSRRHYRRVKAKLSQLEAALRGQGRIPQPTRKHGPDKTPVTETRWFKIGSTVEQHISNGMDLVQARRLIVTQNHYEYGSVVRYHMKYRRWLKTSA